MNRLDDVIALVLDAFPGTEVIASHEEETELERHERISAEARRRLVETTLGWGR